MSQTTHPPLAQLFAGAMMDSAAPLIPPRWYEADGSSQSRIFDPQLFVALNPRQGPVTVTSASPGVITTPSAHGLRIGDRVFLENVGGALPTGITADTNYFVMTTPSGTTLTIGTTRTLNVQDGTIAVTVAVNTSSTGTGTHYLFWSPYGVADSSHFNLPDGRTASTMGEAPTTAYHVLGTKPGELLHVITNAESAAFVLNAVGVDNRANLVAVLQNLAGSSFNVTGGGGLGHNTVHPVLIVKKLIYRGPA